MEGNNDQRRISILQMAGIGLQKAGFGFLMGATTTGQLSDNSITNNSNDSEVEDDYTMEKIIENLRVEVTQLKNSLEDSRSDRERLQKLSEKQAQKILENTKFMNELQNREALLAENVEELLEEIKRAEEEVDRWREACEMEVHTGKKMVEMHDSMAAMLKHELDRSREELEISKNKMKLKEDMAMAAMVAHSAAEKSLRLADCRAAALHKQIEDLAERLEEAEYKQHKRSWKATHICWPWMDFRWNRPTVIGTPFSRIWHFLL